MTNLARLQERLAALDYDGFVIPSTDEYLSEFSQPSLQRLRWATRFTGSTGVAIVLRDRAAIFLDGRYFVQGQRDTAGLGIEVLGPDEATRHDWLASRLRPGQRLAIDTRQQSFVAVERTIAFATERGIAIVELGANPIDDLWDDRPAAIVSEIVDYPTAFAGASATEKCAALQQRLRERAVDLHVVADPEDVAWLLNVRTLDSRGSTPDGWHIVPLPLTRVLVEATGDLLWFVDGSRIAPGLAARLGDAVTLIDPALFESTLTERASGRVTSADLLHTPHRFAAIAARGGRLVDDPVVSHRRWIKAPAEIAGARAGHLRDGAAIIRLLAWIQRTVAERPVTELEAAERLTAIRAESPDYLGNSMPVMSASGPNGGMPHYVPSAESNRTINDHPIYWLDAGAQSFGSSTDNTVTFAFGEPEPRHVRAHTLLVKGLIALSSARFPDGTLSTQLDALARQHLWSEGMDYGTGTGHGVGNFLNIHEGPVIRKEIDNAMIGALRAGMVMTNEPGYYAAGDFGIRVETHMVVVPSRHEGYLEFETISRLPIDPRLLDGSLLTAAERDWLASYHETIADDFAGTFDPDTARWLADIVDAYAGVNAR